MGLVMIAQQVGGMFIMLAPTVVEPAIARGAQSGYVHKVLQLVYE